MGNRDQRWGGAPMSQRYELSRGGIVLGVVTLDSAESDFPWFVGWLEPSAEYRTVKPLFDELDRLAENHGFEEAFDSIHEQIVEPGVRMRSLADGEVSEVVGISIAGNRVSWRI